MYLNSKRKEELHQFIVRALEEDVREGDHSSLACIPADAQGYMQLLVKDEGVLAGVELAEIIFKHVDKSAEIDVLIEDGASVSYGDIAFRVRGNRINLLKAERLVLNCMQRMSAIATKTKAFAQLIEDLPTQILDTRKTTPCIRLLEKWAVVIGGGANHRFGLFDLIMLKDNHIDFAGGIPQAIDKTKTYLSENQLSLNIEIEVRNHKELDEVLAHGGVNRIMLDNFNFEDTRLAVQKINKIYETESSGGIDETTLRDYALCGVDYVSMGALTHSVYNLDLSLKVVPE
ncbi:MAG: carboxylating nicotinate-nucleotide diphosphorylase [Flavobacteriales bacterium]